MTQLGLFEGTKQNYEVEQKTTVRLANRSAQVPLRRRRREATEKLKDVLAELEGKDILVSTCDGARSHFWTDGLLLRRLKVQWGSGWLKEELPTTLVLWGVKTRTRWQQNVRIFLQQLYAVREQYYSNDKPYYLIDFWNGWGEYPIDKYRPQGFVSLHIEAAH